MPDKHLIFLVHGIGAHVADWSKPIRDKLDELAQRYEKFDASGLQDLVEYKEITYDKIFTDQIENWEENFDDLITLAPPGSETSVREALDWMDGMSDQKDNFLWTHVADAVLWKISPYLRNHILTRVGKIVAEGIVRKIDENPFKHKYSILGHSMGTSVVQQSLAALASGAWSGDEFNAFNSSDVRFWSVHMIANVSHYFETDKDVIYDGIVRPGVRDSVTGYCTRYYTYANKFDPICWLGRFDPDWTADDGFSDITVSHIHARDTHSAEHYLQNPKVHIPLIRAITSKRKIKPAEEIDAINSFRQIGGEFDDEVEEFKSKIADLQGSINQFKDLGSWIKGWTAYGNLI